MSSYEYCAYTAVVGQDDQLYVNKSKTGSFHHSSFFNGKPVRAACQLNFHKSKLVKIKMHSGHYLHGYADDQRAQQYCVLKVLQSLLRLGGDLTKTTLVDYCWKQKIQGSLETHFYDHQFDDSGLMRDITKKAAEELLKDRRPGTWLLRSQSGEDDKPQYFVSKLVAATEDGRRIYRHYPVTDELIEDLNRKYGLEFSDGSPRQLRTDK